MANDENPTIGRRQALRLLGMLSSFAAALGITSRLTRAQGITGVSGPGKAGPAAVLAQARADFARPGARDVQSPDHRVGYRHVNDVLSDGMTDFAAAEAEFVGEARGLMKALLSTGQYPQDERVAMKGMLLTVEADIKSAMRRLSRGESSISDAQGSVHRAFATYLRGLDGIAGGR